MALALPLIIEVFHALDHAVQWLSGGEPPASGASRPPAGGRTDPEASSPSSGSTQQRVLRHTAGPLHLHPARRSWRAQHALR